MTENGTIKESLMVLKDCPFCLGEAEKVTFEKMNETFVRCKSCGVCTTMDNSQGDVAIANWNRRTPYPVSRVNLLYGALRSLVYLKTIKDAHGKTDEYLLRQPLAWELARKALDDNCDMSDISVVTWVRYDGTPETAPKTWALIYRESGWRVGFTGVQLGDLWAYLPEAPEDDA